MKKRPLMQTENRVFRTYRGGKLLDAFLGKPHPADSFQPEDWISSFVEAKNKDYRAGEGISRVCTEEGEMPITAAVTEEDFGPGRRDGGVLVKLLDARERLGIQVHPTPAFSRTHFGSAYGKTECWHILQTEPGVDASIYIGFREGITRDKWAKLFREQDTGGMLDALHRFPVKAGDTILVRAGTPHAIGAGCFLLEIQEPPDYTMRAEKTTVAGERLTEQQISYGLGEEALLDCFHYEGLTECEARQRFFLQPRIRQQTDNGLVQSLVTYDDTPCFALEKIEGQGCLKTDSFSTVVALEGGTLSTENESIPFRRGDKIFVPYGCGAVTLQSKSAVVCYPPRI